MTREALENFARRLPPGDPYYRLVFGTRPEQAPPSELERIDKAVFDPRFGANVAFSHATPGLWLPDLDWPAAVRRAHEQWSNPDHVDDNLVLAESLNLPENGGQCAVMHALLACEDGTDELIADCFQCDAEVGTLSNELFWNVRERRAEPFYLAHLQENHWAGLTLPARAQALFGRDLLRWAIRTGKAQVVLAAANILRPSANAVPTEALIEQIFFELLSLAASGLAKGRSSTQTNPALALVLKYKLFPKTQDPGNDSLSGLQLSRTALQPLFDDLAQRLGLARAMNQQISAVIQPG
jgi:hypothetical protein